ncbi:MJ1255/VC2487 family glycosyltransferase [Alteromonas sp. ASW11-130]|uniref:MJ1255/VC2487 family glycosyltransferase n=1 Tax=Alteromonas sp. ASW11-130 TaxID=3015775 RepID=UPI002242A483|nr:MJ1255/VC2487 family glycosyltransferase [Alteromonas sp. ASW11-130]MCW8091063.1 glycosyltransferase [Alteromonas sp. ASW11-130]
MKILYGVQATGNGHIARARIMAAAMQSRNDVEVDFIFSGREAHNYFEMEIFGHYRTFAGLTFFTTRGRVDRLKTFRQAQLRQFIQDVRKLDVSKYDLLINDFEPVTAWAAKIQGLKSISISHQAAFTYAVPRCGDTVVDKLLLKYFAPTNIQVGVHWFHFNQPIIPPFVMEKPVNQHESSLILVYLPFEDIDDIHQMLYPLSEQHFKCYHPSITAEQKCGHISWFPPSKAGFHHALQHCEGVIANGGFELSSEALHLNKKLLVKPLHGQFEQLSNVLTLQKLGLCHTLFQLDSDVVDEWLEAPENEGIRFPDTPGIVVDWLVKGNWEDTTSLCKSLWERVNYGHRTQEKLSSLAI